jgi:glutathione S-transferase
MIDLYTHPSPNAYKVSICLEELALPYHVVPVDLAAGEQKRPAFLSISPAGKVPAIVDLDTGQAIFESAAILLYLADKAGRLIPVDNGPRWEVTTWLLFHAATVGPALAQRANFEAFAEVKVPSVIARLKEMSERLFAVLDARLVDRQYLCDEYSIADIAHFAWLHIAKVGGFSFEPFVNLTNWHARVADRPAVQRGLLIPAAPSGF